MGKLQSAGTWSDQSKFTFLHLTTVTADERRGLIGGYHFVLFKKQSKAKTFFVLDGMWKVRNLCRVFIVIRVCWGGSVFLYVFETLSPGFETVNWVLLLIMYNINVKPIYNKCMYCTGALTKCYFIKIKFLI